MGCGARAFERTRPAHACEGTFTGFAYQVGNFIASSNAVIQTHIAESRQGRGEAQRLCDRAGERDRGRGSGCRGNHGLWDAKRAMFRWVATFPPRKGTTNT